MLEHRRSFSSMQSFYNWFYRFYGMIEKNLDDNLERVAEEIVSHIPSVREKSALDYACGSGLLTLKLAKLFKHTEGRDASIRMIERARMRADQAGASTEFGEGNIMTPMEPAKSFDYVFVSFALHLFPPNAVPSILARLYNIAREGVIVIDHDRKWKPFMAFAEWIEGSYYDSFIKTDFAKIARDIGVNQFEEFSFADCTVLRFLHEA
jgi:ubiquinone/menaquinone biosynthesis C-methylase UbiE